MQKLRLNTVWRIKTNSVDSNATLCSQSRPWYVRKARQRFQNVISPKSSDIVRSETESKASMHRLKCSDTKVNILDALATSISKRTLHKSERSSRWILVRPSNFLKTSPDTMSRTPTVDSSEFPSSFFQYRTWWDLNYVFWQKAASHCRHDLHRCTSTSGTALVDDSSKCQFGQCLEWAIHSYPVWVVSSYSKQLYNLNSVRHQIDHVPCHDDLVLISKCLSEWKKERRLPDFLLITDPDAQFELKYVVEHIVFKTSKSMTRKFQTSSKDAQDGQMRAKSGRVKWKKETDLLIREYFEKFSIQFCDDLTRVKRTDTCSKQKNCIFERFSQ